MISGPTNLEVGSNINLINDYFSRIKTPENITLALLNLNSLSKINLKSHVQLVEEITPLLIDLNKENSNTDLVIRLIF